MKEEESNLLRQKGLSFFGRITASLSHEINNSVAIIGELSGLMDDLLLGAAKGRSIDNGKLKGLSERIVKQVKRGEDMIKSLNRFAHSIDDPVKTFDLKELAKEIAALAQRFAFLKEVRLETAFTEEAITITSDPFSLQHAIFGCIELALMNSEKNDVVTLTLDKEGSGARIAIRGVSIDKAQDIDSKLSLLSVLMRRLGGKVEVVPLDDRQSLVLTVPQSIPAATDEAESTKPANE